MVALDYHASAQKCEPAQCAKAVAMITKANLDQPDVNTKPATAVAAAYNQKECAPSDCPPICRLICPPPCCEGSKAMTAPSKVKKTTLVRLEPIEKLALRKPRPSALIGAD